jgi:hypothetical protein
MAKPTYTPGTDTGNKGGIYQEIGPRGGLKDNFATVPDHTKLPPTTAPGHEWTPLKITPDSNRR